MASVVKIGALLKEAKDHLLEHGEFKKWVKHEFAWSYRSTLRFRATYDLSLKWSRGTFSKLNISLTALYMLADLPMTMKSQF